MKQGWVSAYDILNTQFKQYFFKEKNLYIFFQKGGALKMYLPFQIKLSIQES